MAQEKGIDMVAPGVNGRDVHQTIQRDMESRGYYTEKRKGTMVGFFHGTGHGLGLDVHEPPRVNASDHVLKKGEVVTVEPGLYYPGRGRGPDRGPAGGYGQGSPELDGLSQKTRNRLKRI